MRIQLWIVILLTSLAAPCFATRTLKDELRRAVQVPDHPHRVICLIPSVVDIVYSLGAGADVAAISDFTKYPKEALQKPSIGLPLSPSMEAIVAQHPDLVLGSGDLNVLESAGSLQRLGIHSQYRQSTEPGDRGRYPSRPIAHARGAGESSRRRQTKAAGTHGDLVRPGHDNRQESVYRRAH